MKSRLLDNAKQRIAEEEKAPTTAETVSGCDTDYDEDDFECNCDEDCCDDTCDYCDDDYEDEDEELDDLENY
jgi:hypothetical protein